MNGWKIFYAEINLGAVKTQNPDWAVAAQIPSKFTR